MIKINLNLIYGKEEFKKEFVDLNRIKNTANYLQPHISLSEEFFHPGTLNSSRLLEKVQTILKTKKICCDSDLTKQLFINSYVFFDNEKFIDVLSKYDIELTKIKKILERIDDFKKSGVKYLSINFSKLELLKKHYNIKNVELIINKLNELFYYYPELIELNKTKKKR